MFRTTIKTFGPPRGIDGYPYVVDSHYFEQCMENGIFMRPVPHMGFLDTTAGAIIWYEYSYDNRGYGDQKVWIEFHDHRDAITYKLML